MRSSESDYSGLLGDIGVSSPDRSRGGPEDYGVPASEEGSTRESAGPALSTNGSGVTTTTRGHGDW